MVALACSSYVFLALTMFSSCGLWTQGAVQLATEESIGDKQEVKLPARHLGTWVTLLSPIGKVEVLKIERLTCFQWCQAKRA